MKPERTSHFEAEDPVPARGTGATRQTPEERAAGTEKPVPLRPAFDRAEAEERAERLRIATGRRRTPRWSRSR